MEALRCGLLAGVLALTACGAKEPDSTAQPEMPTGPVELEPQEPVDTVEVENSGRSMSGVYALEAPTASVVAASWTFNADGSYSRTRTLGNGLGDRMDSGTYVIDKAGQLHVFVEQRGEARLSWAERITLALDGDPATAITLSRPDGQAERLVRTGDAPPSKSAAGG